MATTFQYQALRIKNPLVRKQVIDILSVLKQCDTEAKPDAFALDSMFVWSQTEEGHNYWESLERLYGFVNNGESNDYVAAYPITHDIMVDDIPEVIPELSDDIWIHCKTEEEAKHLLQLAHDKGYRWSSNDSYLVDNHWENYRTETVYNVVKGKFGQRCEKPVEKVYPASIIDKLFNNNTIQKTYEQERTERKERTDNNGTAAYIRPTHGTIAVAERRTGNAICYRGCQVLTRTRHSPNGTPAYGI